MFDLGTRWTTDPPVKHEFVLKNAGQAPLEIKGVTSSCGCTTVGAKQVTLQPGQTWALSVELDLKKQKPLVLHTISVYGNDPQRPKLDLKIRGLVRAPVVTTPRNAHFFGQVRKDETRSRTLTITNQTDEPMDLRLGRCDGETFTATIEPVKAGREYRLTMTAHPPYRPGVTVGRIEMTTGLSRQPTLEVRPQVYLPPRLLVTPTALALPQPLAAGARQVVSVRNNGDTDVRILGVSTAMEGVTTEIARLASGKVQNITVRFPNGFKIPAGGGELIIRTDDRQTPELRVRVFGRATATATSATP
jgi:hypothetical protein